MDIIGVGESGVDVFLSVQEMPGRGKKVRAKLLGEFPGGMIGNFCSAAHKLGISCGIVSAVANDAYGRMLLDDYRKNDIDTSNILVEEEGITFYCIIFLDEKGEKYLTTIETPLKTPPADSINLKYIKTAKYVHMNSMNKELVQKVAEGIAGSDTKLSLDYEAHADHPGLESWLEILKQVEILFANEEGAKQLIGENPIEKMAQLQEAGPNTVVITCGEKGGAVRQSENTYYYDAFTVDKIEDTTGAGDCFNASFLSACIKGWPMQDAMTYAAAAAALSITKIGARNGQPQHWQIEKFLKSRNIETKFVQGRYGCE